MSALVMAFCGEGSTDYRFLTRIIERTAGALRPNVEIYPMTPIAKADLEADSEEEIILKAAGEAQGMHLLVYHLDADGPAERVPESRANRFEPGLQLIKAAGDMVCPDVVPVIPVHTLEAWLLADPEALAKAVGTPVKPDELGLPSHPHQVEAVPKPKAALQQALDKACASRSNRRHAGSDRYFATLAETISLERLDKVPAYAQFKRELAEALQRLRM
jgi:hypothetical protein